MAGTLPLVVIPCFNEEARLDIERLGRLAESGRVALLFVDDGSDDGTAALLRRLQDASSSTDVLTLPHNVGKAEAIRRGLLQGIDSGAPVVGYYDADLATPPDELLRLIELLETRPDLEFVMAARVALLGRRVQRHAARHYLGRVFATVAALTLRIPVYDTQCGAKALRVSTAVREAISEPFRSTWVFDVELIGRLLRGSGSAEPIPLAAFEEMPLLAWSDVPGSRLRISGMVRSFVDLLVVGATFRRSGSRIRTSRSSRK